MKSIAPETGELVHAVLETLAQGEALLTHLRDEDYTRQLPVAFNASIGGHYRHCLDHFRILLGAAASGDLNYDQRERDPLVEQDRFAALNATRDLRAGYEQLAAKVVRRPLSVTCQTSYAASGSQVAPSTVGREIMYTVAHAVHHYALISIMGGILGLQMPPGFGVAPSTLKHQAEAAGATAQS